VLHVGRWKCRTQKIAKNSPSVHHLKTLMGYIFANKAHIDNRKKNLNSNISSTCPHNMVNFGPLAAEICWRVWGTPSKFQQVSHLGSVIAWPSSSRHQPNFAALNTGRHLYSAGWPSRWALAHILVMFFFTVQISVQIYVHCITQHTTVLQPLYGKICIIWHPQLRIRDSVGAIACTALLMATRPFTFGTVSYTVFVSVIIIQTIRQ